jgi:DNA-binding response OmpR family regulator
MQATKILYVEDEPFLGKIVKESLESRSFEVKMVADGLEALPCFKSFQPDICVLDVMLPNRDGFSIGKEIAALSPNTPIVFLTAKTQTSDLLEGFKSGGNDYIKKPFSMEELIVRIQNLLQLTSNTPKSKLANTPLQIGLFTFYPLKYQLISHKKVQNLSHRETEILKIFFNNQNKSIDRKSILLKIWGDDSYFNSRNLDVYIKKIRNYLKEDSSIKIITLKGIGYHFLIE